jgi:hypothetical protein
VTEIMSYSNRILRFLKKPALERRETLKTYLNLTVSKTILFKPVFLNFALVYQPDSHSKFHAHGEFFELLNRFNKYNKVNNSGDSHRLWSLILNCKKIIEEGIKGDFAELGVWRGNTAAVLAYFASTDNRDAFLFDTYEGFDERDLRGVDADKRMAFKNTSVELVREVIGSKASERCEFVKGYFPSSVQETHRARKYAVVSLDCDLYEPMKEGLSFFYPLMPKGGIFFLHDYSSMQWNGARQAIDEFCKESGEFIILMPDKSGSAFLRRAL